MFHICLVMTFFMGPNCVLMLASFFYVVCPIGYLYSGDDSTKTSQPYNRDYYIEEESRYEKRIIKFKK